MKSTNDQWYFAFITSHYAAERKSFSARSLIYHREKSLEKSQVLTVFVSLFANKVRYREGTDKDSEMLAMAENDKTNKRAKSSLSGRKQSEVSTFTILFHLFQQTIEV